MKAFNRRDFLLASASLPALHALPAFAQAWPNKPIRIVVTFAPGGSSDIVARLLQPGLQEKLGQPVIVENRPGAGGAVAGASVVKAAPNGLEIFYAASPTMTISPHVLKAMAFDPLKDMTPLATILSYANVLVINQNQPFKTLPELVAFGKANPGK
ncbi:MAG: tripartite tricarboxylate transporter substrate binding protein, partial [Burkholderiales bacterium]